MSSSRSEWHVGCSVTRCGNDAPTSTTPSRSTRNSVNSNTRSRDRRDPLTHVRDTRRRRRDDRVVAPEHAREALEQPAGLVLVARVDVHLPTTRLLQRKLDLAAQPLEQLDDRPPGLREQRVVETGDEQRDLHRYRLGTLTITKEPEINRSRSDRPMLAMARRSAIADLLRDAGAITVTEVESALRRLSDDGPPRPRRARAPGHRPAHARRRRPAVDLRAGGLLRAAGGGRHRGQDEPRRRGRGDALARARPSSWTPARRRTSSRARSSRRGSASRSSPTASR